MPQKISTIIVVLFLISGVAAGNLDARALLAPRQHESYEVKEGKIYYRHGNAGLILESATDQTIASYYRERGAELGNPFGQQGGELGSSTFFLVTLLNRTNGNLTFTPRYVTLKIRTEASFPLDFTMLLSMIENYRPREKKILASSIYHSPETVRPGKIIAKFLIFPPLPKKFREIKLEFDYLYFEDKEIRANFYFSNQNQQ